MAANLVEKDEEYEHLVTFRLAEETYGIPITLVQEIIRFCEVTQIPRSAEYVRGVVNLRGRIVPVIDLRKRLQLPDVEATSGTRIIVVEVEKGVVGMIVDSVAQVLRIPVSQIEPPSELVADVETDFLRGIGRLGEDLIILLDLVRALTMSSVNETLEERVAA